MKIPFAHSAVYLALVVALASEVGEDVVVLEPPEYEVPPITATQDAYSPEPKRRAFMDLSSKRGKRRR